MERTCPFCNVDANRIVAESAVGIALHDAYPVTEGLHWARVRLASLCRRGYSTTCCYYAALARTSQNPGLLVPNILHRTSPSMCRQQHQ